MSAERSPANVAASARARLRGRTTSHTGWIDHDAQEGDRQEERIPEHHRGEEP